MKKHFLTLLAIALLPAAAAAQGNLKLGLNAGATYSGIRGNEIAERNDAALNFMIGAMLEVPITERLSFLTNINYERKTYSGKVDYTIFDPLFNPSDPAFMTGGFTVKPTMSYLSVPLDLKYYVGAKRNFYINGGPFAAFFLGETVKVNGNKADGDDDAFKTLDIGVNLGVGAVIKLDEKSELNIELRDNLGLINISKLPVVNDDTIKTNSLCLILSWQFQL